MSPTPHLITGLGINTSETRSTKQYSCKSRCIISYKKIKCLCNFRYLLARWCRISFSLRLIFYKEHFRTSTFIFSIENVISFNKLTLPWKGNYMSISCRLFSNPYIMSFLYFAYCYVWNLSQINITKLILQIFSVVKSVWPFENFRDQNLGLMEVLNCVKVADWLIWITIHDYMYNLCFSEHMMESGQVVLLSWRNQILHNHMDLKQTITLTKLQQKLVYL